LGRSKVFDSQAVIHWTLLAEHGSNICVLWASNLTAKEDEFVLPIGLAQTFSFLANSPPARRLARFGHRVGGSNQCSAPERSAVRLRNSPFFKILQTNISCLNRLALCSWATGLPEIATGESKSPFFGFRFPSASANCACHFPEDCRSSAYPVATFLRPYGVWRLLIIREIPTSDTLSRRKLAIDHSSPAIFRGDVPLPITSAQPGRFCPIIFHIDRARPTTLLGF